MMRKGEQALPVISEAIRQVRFDRGYSVSFMARWLRITHREVTRLEDGKAEPTTDQLLSIGSLGSPGPAKTAIVEELRKRMQFSPLVKVVA